LITDGAFSRTGGRKIKMFLYHEICSFYVCFSWNITIPWPFWTQTIENHAYWRTSRRLFSHLWTFQCCLSDFIVYANNHLQEVFHDIFVTAFIVKIDISKFPKLYLLLGGIFLSNKY
jgi:hypothetical protein